MSAHKLILVHQSLSATQQRGLYLAGISFAYLRTGVGVRSAAAATHGPGDRDTRHTAGKTERKERSQDDRMPSKLP